MDAARSLFKAGHPVEVVSTELSDGPRSVDGLPHILAGPRKWFFRSLYARARRFPGLYARMVARRLRRRVSAPDLVIVGHIDLLGAARRAFGTSKLVLIVYGREAWRDFTAEEVSLLKACQAVVALSEYTASRVRQRVQDCKLSVIYPQVDTSVFRPADDGVAAEPLVILTVSRLSSAESGKGHDLVVRSLPSLRTRIGKPIEYVIVGDGDLRPVLAKLAQDIGVGAMVRFAGAVWDPVALADYYKRCHVYAMPNAIAKRSAGDYKKGEGFGIVYAEAAACGKPSIACDEGGQTEIVIHEKTGLLVTPDLLSVEEGLYRLLTEAALAAQMGRAGRELVEQMCAISAFDDRWQQMARDQGHLGDRAGR